MQSSFFSLNLNKKFRDACELSMRNSFCGHFYSMGYKNIVYPLYVYTYYIEKVIEFLFFMLIYFLASFSFDVRL